MNQPGPPPIPPAGGPPRWAPPPAGSYAQPYGQPLPTHSDAIAALALGVGAWLCFPLGFVAIWIGARARSAIRENPNSYTGDGMALAGMIVGGVLAGLQTLFFLLYIGVIIVFAVMHKP